MTILNDTHLAYLLDLGFDIDLCKQALTQNSSLETATDWILNPSHPPTLNLGIDLSKPCSSGSQLSPSSASQHDPVKEKQIEEAKLQQKKKFERIANELRKDKLMEKEARQRALLDIKNDQEKRRAKGLGHSVNTNSSNSSNSNSSNQNITERQRIQLAIKKDKQMDREQRQRILQSIKNDKIDKKAKLKNVTTAETSNTSSAGPSRVASSEAFIQFKLSNGSNLREKFPVDTTVRDLFTFILSKEQGSHQDIAVSDISLICSFPRRTFTSADNNLNMKEAGFLPNVSLNVMIVKPPVPEAMESVEPEQEDEIMNEVDNSTEESESMMDTDENENTEESDDSHLFESMIAGVSLINRRQQRAFGPVTSGGHQLTDSSPTEVPNEANVSEDADTQMVDRRANMLSAIEQRSQSASTITNDKSTNVGKKYYTKSLKDTCIVLVARLLSQHTASANRYVKQLMYVSSDVAELLIAQLIKSRQLNVSTLRKLSDHCYLQHIIFDSYSYCTDSLIEDLCKSNSSMSITKLSLRGCDVITDGAIRALERLKKLTYLDLNNCKVTDKGLKSLEKLQCLSYLNLSKTKITDLGIASLVANAQFKEELQVLLLDGCSRVDSGGILIPMVNAFTNLVQLSYPYTTYSQKPEQQTLAIKDVQLRHLDISHTLTIDNDLINTISRFKNLVELKLGGCGAISTRGLSFLPRELKNLRHIQFPNREHELDGVLLRYKDLPLEDLDLSGFLNLTDEGAKSIASMKHLRYLNLDGTKITDEGIVLFQDLIELEKLSLDRTSVTDIGLQKLTGLSKLGTLSLSRTEITNDILCILGDFERNSFARNLRTLNLSQCHLISDRGVRGLSGMANLTNLNLDHTDVSKSCIKYLKDLEHLNPVRLQGIEKEEEEIMDME